MESEAYAPIGVTQQGGFYGDSVVRCYVVPASLSATDKELVSR